MEENAKHLVYVSGVIYAVATALAVITLSAYYTAIGIIACVWGAIVFAGKRWGNK